MSTDGGILETAGIHSGHIWRLFFINGLLCALFFSFFWFEIYLFRVTRFTRPPSLFDDVLLLGILYVFLLVFRYGLSTTFVDLHNLSSCIYSIFISHKKQLSHFRD